MLTLLVNGIVRPLDGHAAHDLQRVDTWLQVIDILATSSERPDLLQKKDFLLHMRTWTVHVVRDTLSGRDNGCCERQNVAYLERAGSSTQDEEDAFGISDLGNVHPDVFPLDQLYLGQTGQSWMDNAAAIAWPYLTMPNPGA